MDDITRVKRKLKSLFEMRLPDKLTALDLEADDGVVTPHPFKIHTADKNSLDGYPAIELIGTGSHPDQRTVAEIYEHRIVVSVTVAGDDEETVTTQVERYVAAVRRIARDTLLADQPTPEVPTGPVETGDEQYTPVTPAAGIEIPFVKGGFIELTVKTVE